MQFSPPEAAALEELSEFLRRLGFELEPFGERTWLLRAAPAPHACGKSTWLLHQIC